MSTTQQTGPNTVIHLGDATAVAVKDESQEVAAVKPEQSTSPPITITPEEFGEWLRKSQARAESDDRLRERRDRLFERGLAAVIPDTPQPSHGIQPPTNRIRMSIAVSARTTFAARRDSELYDRWPFSSCFAVADLRSGPAGC